MFGRLSVVQALPGRKDEVVRLYKEMDKTLHSHKGFVSSYVFTDPEDPNTVGRFALYQSRDELERAATGEKVFTIRSQIHRAIQPGHIEKVVEILPS